MSDLKKKLDKGIAYLKRNGVRKSICRAGRKAVLSREIPYEVWLKGHTTNQKELERQKKEVWKYQEKTEIRIFPTMFTQKQTNVDGNMETENIQTEYVLFLREGTKLRPEAVFEMTKEAEKYEETIVLYTDHDVIGTDGRLKKPFCKPDYDPVWQRQQNYMGAALLVSKEVAEELMKEPVLSEKEITAGTEEKLWQQLEELVLQKAEKTVHLPKLLYHVTEELEKELEEIRTFPKAEIEVREDLLSVIIPNKDHIEDLKLCVNSLLEHGGYEHLEILIVENNSVEQKTFCGYEELQRQDKRIRILNWSGIFNYSAINNEAVRKAKGNYLLFLNNDTQVKEPGALLELMTCIQREKAGAVGARLLYGDLTIQHGGVVLGYGGIAGHAFEGMPQELYEKQRYAKVARQMSAVTAACMLVDRRAFEQIGGFTEELGVAYNDIDLCMKLRRAGWIVVYDPAAQLYHYESQTRGFEMSTQKAERVRREAEYFCQKWKEEIDRGDPFYNPGLTLEKPDFSLRR